MTTNWLPPLIKFEDFDGDWERYINELFAIFYRDFIESQPKYQNKWVRCRRDLIKGKEAAFWHCISEGPDENDRIPDIRRCERISWIRSVIEHSWDDNVDCWPVPKKGETWWLLWLNEEYLVVLAERHRKRDGFKYMQFVTAYCTEKEHRKDKLRKQRDDYNKGKNG